MITTDTLLSMNFQARLCVYRREPPGVSDLKGCIVLSDMTQACTLYMSCVLQLC